MARVDFGCVSIHRIDISFVIGLACIETGARRFPITSLSQRCTSSRAQCEAQLEGAPELP
jgi:hypothetical protein